MIDIAPINAERLRDDLASQGFATMPLLAEFACRELAGLYDHEERFRKRVIMERHSYGRGEYKYFDYELPDLVAELRSELFPALSIVANAWRELLGREVPAFPPTLATYLARCHAAGQTRPTPLLLRYGVGGFNCLHQDLYGELSFPLQATVLLSAPEKDFSGGEFILVEQRPRAQSRAVVVPLRQGEVVFFPVHHRPCAGSRGHYRLNVRHGVSLVRSGQRQTLGLIFHDAA